MPSGTVTFLFTDLDGSTRLWEQHPGAMKAALARHDEILREAIGRRDGHVVKTTGDGFHAVFTADAAAIRGFGVPTAIAAGMASRRGDTTGALELYGAALPELHWMGQRLVIGGILGALSGLLADQDPESAAIIQGAAASIVGLHMPSEHSAREDERAVALLDDELGLQHRTELNARGRAMDETEATDCALVAIQQALESQPRDVAATRATRLTADSK
jgi:class 3 adenylate cyclase